MADKTRRLIIGISGASGVIYGIRALQLLRDTDVETHLVMSKSAEMTMGYEVKIKPSAVRELADVAHAIGDVGASISSGSFNTMGMLVLPCSIRTMSEISSGVTSSLLSRAADVVLKERRRLVLGVRETPLHTGHLRTLVRLSEIGVVVSPIVPANSVVMGAPGKVIRQIGDKEQGMLDSAAQHYVDKYKRYRDKLRIGNERTEA